MHPPEVRARALALVEEGLDDCEISNPVINGEIEALLRRCFPANPVSRVTPPVSQWSGRRETLLIQSVYCATSAVSFLSMDLAKA
jgi:hypothetical protein